MRLDNSTVRNQKHYQWVTILVSTHATVTTTTTTKLDSGAQNVSHRRLRATPPGQRAIGPCRSRTSGQREGVRANSDRRSLRRPAPVARGNFLKIGHFAPFLQFLHIKGRNFRMFLSVHVYLWSLWTMKSFMEIGPHVFLRNPEDRHTDRQTRQLYVYGWVRCGWLVQRVEEALRRNMVSSQVHDTRTPTSPTWNVSGTSACLLATDSDSPSGSTHNTGKLFTHLSAMLARVQITACTLVQAGV